MQHDPPQKLKKRFETSVSALALAGIAGFYGIRATVDISMDHYMDKASQFGLPPAPTPETVENALYALQDTPHTTHLVSENIESIQPAELVHRLLDKNPAVILGDNDHQSLAVIAAIGNIVSDRRYGTVTHYFPERERILQADFDAYPWKSEAPFIADSNPSRLAECVYVMFDDEGETRKELLKQYSNASEEQLTRAAALCENMREIATAIPPTKVVLMDYRSKMFFNMDIPFQKASNIHYYFEKSGLIGPGTEERFSELNKAWWNLRMNESNPAMAQIIRDVLKPEMEAGKDVRAIISVGTGHVGSNLDLNEMLRVPVVNVVPARNIETWKMYNGGKKSADFTLVVPDMKEGIEFDPATYPGLKGPQCVIPDETHIAGKNTPEICR